MPIALTKVKKTVAKKSGGPSFSKMDGATKAVCFALRHPAGKGKKPTPYKDIVKLVKKTDGKRPTIAAVCQIVRDYKLEKKKRGRKTGSQATSTEEDKLLLKTFHKIRPPGHYVDSRQVHKALPKKLQKKTGRRTIIRRLAKKGFTPQRKICKNDITEKTIEKRIAFAKTHKDKTPADWKAALHAVADLKWFTWYPQELQPRFKRYRARWTYMTKKEKKKPAFARPKKWFEPKDWKTVKKVKVFGMTTSNGKSLAFVCPTPWTAADWAELAKKKVIPFLRKCFPGKTSFNLLLDGEPILQEAVAKRALLAGGVSIFPGWPGYSPDLNPQENVWAGAEPKLRQLETGRESFIDWQPKVLKAVMAYPSAEKLIPSMAKRCQNVLKRDGAMLDD